MGERLSRITEDQRPWGGFRQYSLNETSTVKIISVSQGRRLSLQRHERRDELWVVLDPGLDVRIGEQLLQPDPGTELYIPRGTPHRLSCRKSAAAAARVLEVAFGHFDENDIERLEDDYGRLPS